jgi:hypothetical protein
MRLDQPEAHGTPTCSECGREQREGERGSRALRTQEADDSDAPGAIGVGVFCPECATRQFGPEAGAFAAVRKL